jgi:protein TonB
VVVPPELPPVEEAPRAAEVEPQPAPISAGAAGSAGSGGGSGGGDGTGSGPGTGSGVGPGSGGGTGGGTGGGGKRGTPPENRMMIFPPLDNIPKQLRGLDFDVTFWVDATGRVTDLLVEPMISDRKYATKFDELMREYRFKPARDGDGRIVAGTITYQVHLPEN